MDYSFQYQTHAKLNYFRHPLIWHRYENITNIWKKIMSACDIISVTVIFKILTVTFFIFIVRFKLTFIQICSVNLTSCRFFYFYYYIVLIELIFSCIAIIRVITLCFSPLKWVQHGSPQSRKSGHISDCQPERGTEITYWHWNPAADSYS